MSTDLTMVLLEALKDCERVIDILWVSHHANRADAALESARAAIATAESAPKAVLLSRGEINRILWRDSRGHPGIGTPIVDKVEFARAIETAVLAKNGIEVAE